MANRYFVFAPGDVEHGAIEEDILYLKVNAFIQRSLNRNHAKFITHADEIWPDILNN